jgi:hypothetical protein
MLACAAPVIFRISAWQRIGQWTQGLSVDHESDCLPLTYSPSKMLVFYIESSNAIVSPNDGTACEMQKELP